MAGKGGPAIGLDLGTMYSCVGVWEGNHVEIIANDHGSRITPSCVAFSDTEVLIGDAAYSQGGINPNNTVFGKYQVHCAMLCICLGPGSDLRFIVVHFKMVIPIEKHVIRASLTGVLVFGSILSNY